MLLTLFRRITLRQIIWTGCLVTLLYALFSRGVYHSDEHFQILEYARMKLFGTPTADHLAWEYPLQMRSGVQPFVAWVVCRCLVAAGIWSPWLAVTLLQLLSALLSVSVLLLFWRTVRGTFTSEDHSRWFLLTGFCLWFLAYLHVHFNAEMLAGNLLLLLAALTIRCCRGGDGRMPLRGADAPVGNAARGAARREFGWGVLLGAVAGAIFIVRYQMGFALLGYGLWLLVHDRRWRLCGGMVPGLVVMLGVGLLADCWLYGEWTCAPWNYLRENILHARMDLFRHEPWWYYLTAPLLDGGLFFGLLALVATLGFFRRRPRHVVTWMLVPFLLVHFFLAHKEIRFFFPVLFFVPWFLVELFRGSGDRFAGRGWQWALGLLAVMNLGVMCYNLTLTTPDIHFFRVMRDYCRGKDRVVALNLAEETTYYSRMQHFTTPPRVVEARFYMPDNLEFMHCGTPEELEAEARRLRAEGRQVVILSADPGLAEKSPLGLRKIGWSPYPAWVVRHFNFNDWTRFAVRSKNIYEWESRPDAAPETATSPAPETAAGAESAAAYRRSRASSCSLMPIPAA